MFAALGADGVRTTSRLLALGRRGLASAAAIVWLLVLYAATSWLAVGTLSSVQFTQRLASGFHWIVLELQGLEFDRDTAAFEHGVKVGRLGEVEKLEAQFTDFTSHKLQEDEKRLALLALAHKVKEEEALTLHAWKPICAGLPDIVRAEVLEGVLPADCQEIVRIIKDAEGYKLRRTDFTAELKALREEVKTLWRKRQVMIDIKAIDAKSGEGAGQTGANLEQKLELYKHLRFMDTWKFRPFIDMPGPVLTLLLTIAMGILGGTITMTWTFLNRDERVGPRWYIMRPFVGALSAMVLFIFFKAGQMTISASGGGDGLDPFFLSFVGITAGLLSDRAYAQMEQVGGRFLSTEARDPDRWAVDLAGRLAGLSTDVTAMAAAIGAAPDRLAKIIALELPASVAEQRLIAAFLKTPQRQLFTDLPPG